jgi:hypothetical protein
MHLMRGVDQPPTSGRIIYHVAVCDRCEDIEPPSRAGKPCPSCKGTLSAVDVDFWDEKNEALKRRIMHRTAMMFQRTHIPSQMKPYQMGWFLVAMNLSDIAARLFRVTFDLLDRRGDRLNRIDGWVI